MKRFVFILALTIFLTIGGCAYAETVDCGGSSRCTTCDLCSYCFNKNNVDPIPTPGNWESCRNCLYPNLTGVPATENQTLKINDGENIGPSPVPGSWYTMLGCISTNTGGFSTQGAAGGVTQTLLRSIFGIVGGIAFLYILYGSFLILTSQADMERLNHGKRVVFGAIIGVIFSLSAVFLVNIIGNSILKIPGLSPTPSPVYPY